MNIVIIGDGKIGSTLAEQLLREGHDIVVVDNNAEVLENSISMQDIMCVEGNGALMEIQEEAGVKDADVVVACTSMDELNMLCCLMAKKLGAKKTIARVRNPEYYSQINLIKDDLGLSMYINPEFSAAAEISRLLIFPSAEKIELFAKGRVELVEHTVAEDNPICGYALKDIYKKYKIKMLVCAVQRGNEVYIPDGNFVLESGDIINISATHSEIEKFFHHTDTKKRKVSSVMIIGGGKIGYYLAKKLSELKMQVKIVDNDMERCRQLSELLPEVSVIFGDGTDQALLYEEGIDQVDAMVALTGMDEENFIVSMFCKSITVPKIITKINRETYIDMAEKLGLESIITPASISANHVISYVRAIKNSEGSNEETLYRLINNRLEALEFIITENESYVGKPLKELTLKKNNLIACIVRHRKIIIPNGDDRIEVGDSVIVVTTNTNAVHDIKEIIG